MAEFASKGVANTGLGLGIAGTAGWLLNGGLGNIFGGGMCGNNCAANSFANRYEMNMSQELAVKDSEIALLKADKYTDQKIVEAYKDLVGQINALSAQVQANKDEQYGVNMQQAVYNGTNTAAISCLQNQVTQLMSLTKLVVPNASVCPGWGNVNVTPATTTTTTSPAA